MHRPTRQLNHLLDKIARKESRAKAGEKKIGPRAKLWKKWAEAYKPLSEANANANADAGANTNEG